MKKHYTGDQIIGGIRRHDAGTRVDGICRKINIASGTFFITGAASTHNWRSTRVSD